MKNNNIIDDLDELWNSEDIEEKSNWRNKYTRRRVGRHKLIRLYKNTKNKYGVGVFYYERKHRLVRWSINNAGIRRLCNRRFRRRLNSGKYEKVQDGSSYKKYEEYWWQIV